jgi:hypothetical protein
VLGRVHRIRRGGCQNRPKLARTRISNGQEAKEPEVRGKDPRVASTILTLEGGSSAPSLDGDKSELARRARLRPSRAGARDPLPE